MGRGVTSIQFGTTVVQKGIISLRRQAILPLQLLGQMLLSILNGLCNVFRGAKAPSQNVVS
jgi:hypothetical protein